MQATDVISLFHQLASWVGLLAFFAIVMLSVMCLRFWRKSLALAQNTEADQKLIIADAALQQCLERIQALEDSALDGVVGIDQAGKVIAWNPQAEVIFGYSGAQALGRGVAELIIPPTLRSAHRQGMQRYLETGISTIIGKRIETRAVRADGAELPIELTVSALTQKGTLVFNAYVRDISERKQAEEALRSSEERFRTIFNEAPLGIALVESLTGRFCAVNPMYTQITGRSVDEMLSTDWMSITYPEDVPKEMGPMALMNRGEITGFHLEKRYVHANGSIVWVNLTVKRVSQYGGLRSHLAMVEDITPHKQAEATIYDLAFLDTLTRLPNRRLLQDRLTHVLASETRKKYRGAILFIDLDNFKTLNDTRGHQIGDVLLIEIASRILNCTHPDDMVARLGNDEFVVVLHTLSMEIDQAAFQAEKVAEKIHKAIKQPCELNGQEYYCSACIGISLFQAAETTVEELLKHADAAMSQAKQSGRDSINFFDTTMQAALESRVLLESWLRKAVPMEFRLYYQAQVDHGGHVFGAEVLIRWQHPEKGVISPAAFIPLAEETGLILPIGQWVLESACAQLKAWESNPATRHLLLAVNVSAKQFCQPNFVEQVLTVLNQTGADPQKLKLELTESMLVDNVDEIISKMAALKAEGVRFSLDDFGTGFSSLSYLKRLPLNQLKIDQSFVHDALTDPNNAAIVRTVIALGQSLSMEVIAEGVETEAQRNFLAVHGCNYYQGYLFAKPVPLAEFEQLLKRD